MKVWIVQHGDSRHGYHNASVHRTLKSAVHSVPGHYAQHKKYYGDSGHSLRKRDNHAFRAGDYQAMIEKFVLEEAP